MDRAGQAFIKYQVAKEVKDEDSERLTGCTKKAEALTQQYRIDINKTQQDLANNLPHKIASVIAAMCRLDCKIGLVNLPLQKSI